VGCDLHRKLLPDDRIVYPARTGLKKDLDVNLILRILTFALFFKAVDDEGKPFPNDVVFYEKLKNGPENILVEVCGFDPDEHKEVFEKVLAWFVGLQKDPDYLHKMIDDD
jgi:hypothetical protein